ncbi:DUF222 domain-containing protein [Nocardioides panaciterrulae]|uniref:DUF222 domain-containing protein n=1 Tax=Nocardioides panaciterrulae TaxID=661492 RepID=A0A7Y9E8G9_9ACTN|nr:DUF222 domain-containing protein [Nocardioides panaciterrulae]NYD42845.1 hypothetical protein [Nocardioides panaciterrulae]
MAPIDDLDPQALLARAEQCVVERRRSGLTELLLASQWAVLHATDPKDDPGHREVPGGDRLVRVGGEGTPRLRQLSLAELGIAFDTHTTGARALVADALDLAHRLPQTWAAAQELGCDTWVVRKVAKLTRELSAQAVGLVDTAVAPVLNTLPTGRLLALVEAKVIEADPEAYAEKVEAELRRRFVGLSRTDTHGLRTVYARLDAGDATWLDAIIDQLADILDQREDLRPQTPRDLGRDELRALAFGWLARPAEALELILDSTHGQAPAEVEEEPSRAVALSERALELLGSLDLTRLRPTAQLFCHLHQDALTGRVPGVARIEDLGPRLLAHLATLLGHTNVTLTPVLDLATQRAVDGYEHPTSMRTRTRLRNPADTFPGSTTITGTGRQAVDIDHPVPYDPDGPPGQTRDTNAQPLTRGHHRAKTHLPYQVWIIDSTTKLWKTPHGRWRIVDHQGTHLPQVLELDPTFPTCVA